MHVVYVCSPDRGNQLFYSLRSLVSSGTTFRRVTIYCVGPIPASWRFGDPRFVVETVPDLDPGFWMANKVHLCRAEGPRVLFLDTDAIILRPLDRFVEGGADVAGRLSTYVLWNTWDARLWNRLLRDHGAACDFPYLNTGVIAFRRPIPAGLAPAWLAITRELRTSRHPGLDPRRRANQLAFSLACGAENLTHDLLTPRDHAYGWRRESSDGVTVFHAGTTAFFRHAHRLAKQTRGREAALPLPVPSLRWPRWREILCHPLRGIRGRLEMALKARS